jgi:Spy/CpxP family protein refolding chaperone
MKYLKLFLLIFTAFAAISAAHGQDGSPPGDAPQDERDDSRRPNLLAELGLSREQIQQIRRMNQERRPMMMGAQRRMREANRALDLAIYADTVSDSEFQARLAEFRAAQSELVRLRFESELAVRKVLTPEQLVKFRELRRQLAERRENNIRERRMRRGRQGLPPMQDGRQRRPPDQE